MAYFDNNSTTRPLLEVLQAVQSASEISWANPSSPHRQGIRVRALMEKVREEIAQSLAVEPKTLTFTSGATESNNAILSSLAKDGSEPGKSILVSAIEHPSILETAHHCYGGNVRLIPVNSDGVVEMEDFKKLMDLELPGLVSLMAVHNETGVLQPWQEVADFCKDRGVWFHCDATQWMGKLDHCGFHSCSSFSFSAHKFGGPKGVGVLVSSEPVSWIKGGGQEAEKRGGTENFPGIEGMRVAWKHQCISSSDYGKLEDWRNNFEQSLFTQIPGLKVIGHKAPRLWNTSLLCLPDFENVQWVSKLDKLGFSVSTGSACSTAREHPSTLAGAIGLSKAEGRRLVRVSSYSDTTEQDWLNLANAFVDALLELESERQNAGVITL